MNYRILIHTLINLTNELSQNKEKEIQRLIKSGNTYPWIIELRKEEANKLRKLAEGLTLVESTGLMRLEAYFYLDKKLRSLTQAAPCLKGHIVILGQDKPELFPYYSRTTYNIPKTFFKA